MFESRKGCSKTEKDVLEQFLRQKKCLFWSVLFQKVCKSVIAHCTPQNEPEARTLHILFRMNFERTRTLATAHRTCVCAHAPSQPMPCRLELKVFLSCREGILLVPNALFLK